MTIRNRIKAYIIEKELLHPGSRVLLGLSGGADSVCLLYILKGLEAELGFSLRALHVQHGIRGAEAERDLCFSREMSASLGVPFEAVRLDVPDYASSHGLGLEEAARLLRYRALRESLSAWLEAEGAAGSDGVIAVAHHQDDQAETVLHNLFRGSGLRGLAGMTARHEDIIRPLLAVNRKEILAVLKEAGLSYVTDSTNAELQYTRNRIRGRLLPEIREINARAEEHITGTAALIAEAEEFLQERAKALAGEYREEVPAEERGNAGSGDVVKEIRISLPALRKEKPIMRRCIMMELLQELGVPMKDWGAVHFRDMDALLFKQGGAHLDLPYRVCADIRKKQLILSLHQEINSMKRRKKHE